MLAHSLDQDYPVFDPVPVKNAWVTCWSDPRLSLYGRWCVSSTGHLLNRTVARMLATVQQGGTRMKGSKCCWQIDNTTGKR